MTTNPQFYRHCAWCNPVPTWGLANFKALGISVTSGICPTCTEDVLQQAAKGGGDEWSHVAPKPQVDQQPGLKDDMRRWHWKRHFQCLSANPKLAMYHRAMAVALQKELRPKGRS